MCTPTTAAIRSGSGASVAPPGYTVTRPVAWSASRASMTARRDADGSVASTSLLTVSSTTSVARPVPAPSSSTGPAAGSTPASAAASRGRIGVHADLLSRWRYSPDAAYSWYATVDPPNEYDCREQRSWL